MKSLGEFPDLFLAEIAGQPAALRRAASAVEREGAHLRAVAAAAEVRRIVFTGMGSSYHASYPATTELAGRALSVASVDAAELLHFRRATLRRDVLLVVVSQSGRSAEVVRLLDELAGIPDRPFVVTVTNGVDNPTARAADVAFDSHAGDEEGPSTMTFAASLVVLAAIALAIVHEPQAIDHVRRGAEAAARWMDVMLEDATGHAAGLRDWFGARATLVVLGRGRARAASEMGALTLKEAARLPAEALESAQFRHGPMELAGPDLAAAVLATDPEVRDIDLRLAHELAAAGTAVLAVTDSPGTHGSDGSDGVRSIVTGHVEPLIAPAAAILPLQLLAWRLAVDRGLTPGAYTRVSKVTVRE